MKEILGRTLEPDETLVWRDPAFRRLWVLPLLYPLGPARAAFVLQPLGLKPVEPKFFSDMFWIFTGMVNT